MANRKRPELNINISLYDFNNFYWLKKELIVFCRKYKLSSTGSKGELSDNIRKYLESGNISVSTSRPQTVSKFDWNNAPLSLATKITDNYRNTEHVRRFMTNHIGSHFKFNTLFMEWMKSNVGKTLAEAITAWKRILEERKNKKSIIAPQFEYNTYIRDILADNPSMKLKDAIEHWKIKKSKEGNNKYAKEDLQHPCSC